MKKVGSVLVLTTLTLVLGVQLNAEPVPALSVSAVALRDGPQPQSDPGKTSEVKVSPEK